MRNCSPSGDASYDVQLLAVWRRLLRCATARRLKTPPTMRNCSPSGDASYDAQPFAAWRRLLRMRNCSPPGDASYGCV